MIPLQNTGTKVPFGQLFFVINMWQLITMFTSGVRWPVPVVTARESLHNGGQPSPCTATQELGSTNMQVRMCTLANVNSAWRLDAVHVHGRCYFKCNDALGVIDRCFQRVLS